ncbi:MAG: oxygen-independent coproporphyrinogen III oxidase [Pseudomonadota bacterium]
MDTRSQLARHGLFSERPPRYTSYPPAPHFLASVGEDTYRDWIGALPADRPVSVYVHIPFCRRLCWFCACRTQGARTPEPVERYLSILLTEIERLGEVLPGGRARLSRLHWGGGTPTILTAAQMERLTSAIHSVFDFDDDAEFSVEIDPNEIGPQRLLTLSKIGMTRASVGVQDFDPNIQKTIGREQSYSVTAEAVQGLRGVGIESLNADLVYGLPGQSVATLERTVKRLLWLKPDRIALYGYAHVPTRARRQVMIPERDLPDGPARLALFEAARDIFVGAGYRQIGIDHFALPSDGLARAAEAGTLHRNFQGYTDDTAETLIGLGASSISEFPQGYCQNAAATAAWQDRITSGGLATARGHVNSADDRMRKRVIERIMCDFGVSLDSPDMSLLRAEATLIAAKYNGFATMWGGRFQIVPEGRALTRIIAQEFDAYRHNSTPLSGAI